MKRNYLTFASFAFLLLLVAAAPATAAHIQTDGHTDIRFIYQDGVADLVYYLDQGSTVDGQSISIANPVGGTPVTVSGGQTKITYQPSQLITYVPDPPVSRPAGAAWDFTGVSVGEPLWFIPMTQDHSKPWTGISTESVSAADFSSIRYQLTAFNGPGEMSLTTTGAFGSQTIYFQTSNGLSGDDKVDTTVGQHIHFNWFFTAPGVYTLELTAIGTLMPVAGGGAVSVADTFTFWVAVPEPSSMALMGMAGLAMVGVLRRRR